MSFDQSDKEWLRKQFRAIGEAQTELGRRLEKMEKRMNAQTQQIIDRITGLTSVVQGIKDSSKAKDAEIQGLKDQVTALQAKVDAGDDITAEDLNAISERLANLEAINTADVTAIPANTPAA